MACIPASLESFAVNVTLKPYDSAIFLKLFQTPLDNNELTE